MITREINHGYGTSATVWGNHGYLTITTDSLTKQGYGTSAATVLRRRRPWIFDCRGYEKSVKDIREGSLVYSKESID